MQEQQAELGARLQDKQLQVVKAAEQFQPVMANLDKVWRLFCFVCLDKVQECAAF